MKFSQYTWNLYKQSSDGQKAIKEFEVANLLDKSTNNIFKTMKKILFILIIIMPVIDASAKKMPIKEVNKKWNIGLMGGYAGYGKDISNAAVGFSLTIKGFYADVMGWPSSHENDTGVDKWSDTKCNMVHVGYQIPIVKSFRFVPIIGYAKIAHGTTDGSDYDISDSGTIHNKFSEGKSVSGFDFGGVAVINIK